MYEIIGNVYWNHVHENLLWTIHGQYKYKLSIDQSEGNTFYHMHQQNWAFSYYGDEAVQNIKTFAKTTMDVRKKIIEVRKHLIIYISSIWLTKSRQNFNWSIVFPTGLSSSSCLTLTYCNPVKKVGTCQQVTENTMHEKSQNELIQLIN